MDISLSNAIPPAAVIHIVRVAYGYSPNSQDSKRLPSSIHNRSLSILFSNPTSFFILDFPWVFNGARFIAHTKNPEACRLPVRPFQTSAKLFPLEDSLSGPMTLLASIPPLCKILSHNGTTRYSTTPQVPSLERIFLHRHQTILILIAILHSSALLNQILIKSKVQLSLWARCLCCPIPLAIRYSQISLTDDFG